MILEILTILLIGTIILIIIKIIIENKFKKYKKLNLLFKSIIILMLLFPFILFYIAMSEVTNVGVGSFTGEGTLAVTLPGSNEINDINCNWGFGTGMYLIIISLILNSIFLFKKIINRLKK